MGRLSIFKLMKEAVDCGASDIHLSAGEIPAMRINGEIQRLKLPELHPEDARVMAYSILKESQKARFEKDKELDCAVSLKGLARFRVNVFEQHRGIGMVLRQIPERIMTLEDLNAPSVLGKLAQLRQGLVLVTGPTGSGKSTTLAAILNRINLTRRDHIVTIEDPLEFIHPPGLCVVNQRELGTHTRSFDAALRSALREDPDVILVGEMRDLETIGLALTAAETGHLVFGTLHTRSASETVDRIIDAFPPEQQEQIRAQLSLSLEAIVSQVLMRNRGGKGRVAAQEILLFNPAARNMIREGKTHHLISVIQTHRGEGMQTLEDSLRELVKHGQIDRHTAITVSRNPKLFD